MSRLAKLGLLCIGSALASFAQPATTTVADTLYAAIGGPTYCSGTITLTWNTFYSKDGYLIQGGTSAPQPVTAGAFSIAVVPTNTNVTPAAGLYTIRYNVQPSGCAPATEYWNVPSSMTPVGLNMVRTLPTPPPSLIPVTSLYPPLTGTQIPLCYTNGVVQWTTNCAGSGTVTSVALSMPGIFAVSGSPITGSGTFSVTLGTESANYVWAGPTSGSAAAPTFRALVAADLPSLTSGTSILYGNGSGGFSNVTIGSGLSFIGGTLASTGGGSGTVTSVGLSLPGIFSVTGSPVTSSGTLTAALASQSGNLVFASPNGSSGTPTFRALVGADLPDPTSSTLGGVESIASVSHEFLTQISTMGVPSQARPACADLSDSSTGCSASALPPNGSAGGDLSGSYPNPGVAKVNGGSIPASTNGLKSNGSSQLVAQTSSDVIAEFSGCSGTQYLGADGSCHTAGGLSVSGFYLYDGTYYYVGSPLAVVTPPTFASFSWLTTQGSSTAASSGGGIYFTAPSSSGDVLRLFGLAISSDTTLVAAYKININVQNYIQAGLCLYESGSGKIVAFWDSADSSSPTYGFQISEWTNSTSFSASVYSGASGSAPNLAVIWEKIQITGGNILFSTSADGSNWTQVYSQATNHFFSTAPDNWSICADANNSGGSGTAQLTLLDFATS